MESCSPGTTFWTVRVSGGVRGQPGWPGRGWVLRAEPQELRCPGLLGDSDDSCDTVILSPTARAVRNVRNVMYLHQEGEEEEEEEEEEDDGEEIEQEHEGKKVVVSAGVRGWARLAPLRRRGRSLGRGAGLPSGETG